MIFATVGTQGQFDRLIRTVDEWAGAQGRTDVFAQTGPSDYHSEHIRTQRFIDPTEFRKRVEAASVVISHAGMGSIITALELGKKIIVMPRRASLGEHRNDHQLATAKRFAEQGRIMVAFTEQELLGKLDQVQAVAETERLSAQASPSLISTIRTFIGTGRIRFENRDVSP
ncbi:glycosyltransferase [Bradyrhizobium sp. dw_411]|uniref:glycosyltransferase n=1 Tax=Bradyrhizobium sp. dw_411 TaxID=2720082 RepID=UPI001BCAB17F|nr:glycosyltransferase [Bradyrhizobium sp. dw_411]